MQNNKYKFLKLIIAFIIILVVGIFLFNIGTKKPLAKPIFPLGIEYELFSDFTDLNELLLFPIINFHPFLKLKKWFFSKAIINIITYFYNIIQYICEKNVKRMFIFKDFP